MESKTFNLSDNAISSLVQMLQLAIITGTDISDWFRMLQLEQDGNKLKLSEDYREVFNQQIEKLKDDAERLLNESQNEGE